MYDPTFCFEWHESALTASEQRVNLKLESTDLFAEAASPYDMASKLSRASAFFTEMGKKSS